ncbi:type II toxin-antitoxin system RelE/ParE family toxin [uncultured Selenomonas sp.]|uniref:type II toxin-antitoxin system RelE/ParE family toxin n=1 Tax=uncultured Selenomonas sp. TaxID=159275 RepID=UPI0025D071B3|nr:type II toxin-antitoxin system RelE/ParE family toxin [uncultured Selenomonas sp.]
MSDAYTVVYTTEAKNDLFEIYAHIAYDLEAPEAAKEQVTRIRAEIRTLDFMPARYEAVRWEPWKSLNMRRIPVNRFVIYYAIDEAQRTVTIVRIFYGGRDVENIIKEGRT